MYNDYYLEEINNKLSTTNNALDTIKTNQQTIITNQTTMITILQDLDRGALLIVVAIMFALIYKFIERCLK